MTGESHPAHKSAQQESPFVLRGHEGAGRERDVPGDGVGMRTEWGHLMAKLSEEGRTRRRCRSGFAAIISIGVVFYYFFPFLGF